MLLLEKRAGTQNNWRCALSKRWGEHNGLSFNVANSLYFSLVSPTLATCNSNLENLPWIILNLASMNFASKRYTYNRQMMPQLSKNRNIDFQGSSETFTIFPIPFLLHLWCSCFSPSLLINNSSSNSPNFLVEYACLPLIQSLFFGDWVFRNVPQFFRVRVLLSWGSNLSAL